jgi:hypothetical protein
MIKEKLGNLLTTKPMVYLVNLSLNNFVQYVLICIHLD